MNAESGSRSLAVHDYLTVRDRLSSELNRLDYTLHLEHVAREEIAAAKASKKTAAMELEATSPLTESVQHHVQQNVQKAIGPLKAHIARLQQSLKARAG